MSTSTNYIPGVCNINPMEIRRRRMSGHFGLAIVIVLLAALFVLHASWYVRIVIFIPAFVAAIGYLQAHNKFCVGYASSSKQHADDGEVKDITDKEALALDKKKTRKMNVQAATIAAVLTIVICFIPF